MSFNHSKSDRNDPAAYRKTGRSTSFNQQRGSSGAHGRGGGGGGGGGGGYAPASTSASSLSSSRSFNKKSNNAQGGQSRANPSPVNSTESNYASAARITSNGTHVQPQVHGASDGPVTKSSESSAAQRSSRVVSKAPTSQKSSMSSDTAAPPSPAKGGDASNVFSFQFGSISVGVTNGMAIPARTNSAPPNLDEQKRDQARHESYRSAVSAPVPPVPRQQQPSRKDAGFTEQSNAGEPYMGTKFKQDPQVSALTPLNQMQKLSVPASGISMVALPYHQSQASLQFGGPNPQIPSQSLSTASLQMPIPMPLPIGNAAQVQPQVFVQGLQPHPMHPQGIIHQSQNMSFIPHPLSHQLGNMGIGMGHQYSQPQGGKFAGPRKPTLVKITHPDTHQELKLEKREDAYSDGGSSGARSHPNVPSQSQPVKSFSASHPINYYSPSSYNPSSLYYPPSSSLPMTNSLITTNSQPPIFNSPVSHAPQNVGFMNSPSLGSVSVSKANTPIPGIVEPTNVEFSRDVPNMSGVASVTIKSSVVSSVVDSSSANSSVSDVQNSEPPGSSLNCDAGSTVPQKECEILDTSPQQSKYSSDSSVSCSLPKQSVASVAVTTDKLTVTPSVLHTSDVSGDSISVVSNHEQKRESLSRSNSLKDNQKKPGKKGQSSQHQVSVQSPAVDSVPSQAVDSGISDTGVSESVGTKTNDYVGIPSEDSPISETLSGSISGAIETKINGSGEASACVSSEGSDSGALASGSLNNHMHDKIDESSEDLQCADLPEKTLMDVNDGSENSGGGSMSLSVSGSKDTTNLEANRGKTTTKGKKKRREILQKADAAGSTSDLYNAYKGPEEKKEAVLISQSTEGASISENLKQFPAEAALSDAKASEKNNHIKAEPDDWENAADMSTPKLKVDEESPPVIDGTAKKYSRDFLLKFAEQCPDLPEGFEITADIAEALVSANRNSFHVIERDFHPSPGRIVDRPGGMSRTERRRMSRTERCGNVATEDDRLSKVSNAFHSGRGLDGSGGNAGFRSGQGGGVLGNPRAQASMQYAGGVLSSMQYAGGVLSGPMQSAGNQGGMQRNNSDGERWQRGPSFQHRGLIPSPTSQTPLQLMHKAEKKYEVGKVSDTEEVKQRQLKGLSSPGTCSSQALLEPSHPKHCSAQPKHRGTQPSKSQMASNADSVESKLWPKLVVKEFIDVMVDEVTNGNMPNGVFHTRTWTSMTAKLNFKTKLSYKKKQLKAEMHRLRALYCEFSALLNHTGFGWNPETNTVTASEEVWKDYIRVHDKAAQFQRRGLDHYKLLGIIFNKNTATGVLHHSSTQDPPNTDDEIELENQYRNNGVHVNLDNDSSNDDVQELERVTRSGKHLIQEKEGKSKKSTRTCQMGDALAAWADASKARADRYRGHSMEATSSIVTPDFSITKCVTALEGIEGISLDTYMKACEKFKEAEYREMFLAMSAEMRQAWLYRL